jgi:hypothetical protein
MSKTAIFRPRSSPAVEVTTTRAAAGQDRRPPAPPERYLLFAGMQPAPNGGLGDPLDTFTSEDVARRAFRDVRLRLSSPTSWAQLAVVDDRHGLKPMCWFGPGAEPERRAGRAAGERDHPAPRAPVARATTAAPPRPQRLVLLACWVLALLVVTGIAGPVLPSSQGDIVLGLLAAVLAGALIIVAVTRVPKGRRRIGNWRNHELG